MSRLLHFLSLIQASTTGLRHAYPFIIHKAASGEREFPPSIFVLALILVLTLTSSGTEGGEMKKRKAGMKEGG